MGSLQPGVEFVNRGISGQRSREIAARQGGEMVQVEVSGGIPASESVAVTNVSQRILNRTGHSGGSIHGSILGVPGTLSVPPGAENALSYTFTRDSSGVAIPVPAGTYFVPDDAVEYRRDAQIIWVGRNDVTGSNPVLAVHAMVKWPSPAVKRVLVLSYTGDSAWVKGSPQHSEVVRINLELSSFCGDSYVDLRRWLIDHGLDAVGITPTQADVDAIAGDTIPPSLAPDGTHFTQAAQNAIGTWLHGELLARGWWSTSA